MMAAFSLAIQANTLAWSDTHFGEQRQTCPHLLHTQHTSPTPTEMPQFLSQNLPECTNRAGSHCAAGRARPVQATHPSLSLPWLLINRVTLDTSQHQRLHFLSCKMG